MQKEIIDPGPLLEDGRLRQAGYSKRFLLDYHPEDVRPHRSKKLSRLRLKEWDYWAVTTPDFFLAASVANLGYMGLAFAYLIDFETGEVFENDRPTPFGAGCDLPHSSGSGSIEFNKGAVRVEFLDRGAERLINVAWKKFRKSDDLAAEIVVELRPKDDSIVMATPIGENGFYYNHKINCLPASGKITFGDRTRELPEGKSFASLDWGRGVWPYNSFWNWASMSGLTAAGQRVGLNLGVGFGDLSAATENCFYLDGKMHKLGRVDFNYDPTNFKSPWLFADDADRLQLTFKPFIDRVSRVNLVALKSQVHQLFGRYSGRLITDEGAEILLDGQLGWAEEHHARW